jgi:acyl carrier protein
MIVFRCIACKILEEAGSNSEARSPHREELARIFGPGDFLFLQLGNSARTENRPQRGMCPMNENKDSIQNPQEAELARLIVTTLNLEVSPMQIDPRAPLYGEGLGLDSIDMLEIALVVSQEFGVKLRADDKNNVQIFSSLRNLNAYVQQNRGS